MKAWMRSASTTAIATVSTSSISDLIGELRVARVDLRPSSHHKKPMRSGGQ
jgi:hypothetical protein